MGFRLVPKSVTSNDQLSATDALLLFAVAEILMFSSLPSKHRPPANTANCFTVTVKQIKIW